jgi:DNA-binding GntR family transcriptional regulator
VNAGATTERVRNALRQAIQMREVRPGAKLDPVLLAGTLLTSATPVREALNLLCGEGLVDARPGGGFHVPLIDAPALADLYDWTGAVLEIVLRSSNLAGISAPPADRARGDEIAARTALLTEAIARSSPNQEHLRAVRNLNARLHAARRVEPGLIEGTAGEVQQLEDTTRRGDLASLRRQWRHYHRRRIRAAGEIVRALLRD